MSIVTKTGDEGETSLMYQRRLSKCHPRVEAYGEVDELSSCIGMARALTQEPFVSEQLLSVQRDLVHLMGELATAIEDIPRFVKDGFLQITPDFTGRLDAAVAKLEARQVTFRGWATPGANPSAAALDVARTVCRRAERRVCALQQSRQLENPEIIVYLNRLSDLLWLLARSAEPQAPADQPTR